MGKNCERMRELLVELVYDELDPMDEELVAGHLQDCDDCARRADAFEAVRGDLQAWDDVEPAPSRVTFVPMSSARTGRGKRDRGGLGRWLPVAASFVLGLALTVAVASYQQGVGVAGQGADDGLAGPDPSSSAAVPVEGAGDSAPSGTPVTPVSTRGADALPAQQLDAWLDEELAARGYVREGRAVEVPAEEVVPLFEELMAERERELRDVVRQMVAESERRQREEFDAALASLYQAFDSQRTDDLLTLAGRLGLLEEVTGQELDRTNAAIDYLITQVANREQSPERRE